MKREKRSISLILRVGLTLLLCACGRQGSGSEGENIVPVTRGDLSRSVTFIGNVSSAQSSQLLWKTEGVIDTVSVALGDSVAEGQTLAVLGRDSLNASVINAEIPLIQAEESLMDILESETAKAQAYKDLRDKEVALADAESHKESLAYPRELTENMAYWTKEAEAAKQLYDEAKQRFDDVISYKYSTVKSETDTYDRLEAEMLTQLNKYAEAYNNYVYYTGIPSLNDNEQAEADIAVAKSDFEKALKAFATYEVYPRPKDVTAAELKIENARQTYDTRSVIADINGTVTSITMREGDYVTTGSVAVRLDNMDHLYIPVDISEIDIVKIRDGMKAEIVLDANRGKTYEGLVTTVSASGDEDASRVTFGTLVEILNPDDSVMVGMTAEVKLVFEERHGVLMVPNNALYTEYGESRVTLQTAEGEKSVPVTTGMSTDAVTEILSGLSEGDRVKVPSVDTAALSEMGLSGDGPIPPDESMDEQRNEHENSDKGENRNGSNS